MMDAFVLTLPGLWNSGPLHWQTHWEEKHENWQRVIQRNWDTPDCSEWIETLSRAIAGCARPPVLAAHSLACALIAHWAGSRNPSKIAGAFLVAPSDVEAPSFPVGTSGFSPMPMQRLPFPSRVIASSDDPLVSAQRASTFATAWGSEITFIGNAGHINGDAGYGLWPEGEKMLLQFCSRLQT
jgi:uncharacterized protein